MKQAIINHIEKMTQKEILNFLLILKEFFIRYTYYNNASLKEENHIDKVVLQNLIVERNEYLNKMFTELRRVNGLKVPVNARPWQQNIDKQFAFVQQIFLLLKDPDVQKCINQ